MKITSALIDKLVRLRDGDTLPASQATGAWVDDFLRDGIMVSTSRGTRRTLYAPDPAAFCKALSAVDERLADLDLMRESLSSEDASRARQASESGNSKLVTARSCLGFPVNSYEPIPCMMNGRELTINPQEGTFVFVTDWQSFTIPEDVMVVGIENMENFRMIRHQRTLFEEVVCNRRILFVSRYPQSSDLRSWLQTIPNRYIHFGDFDLAGIHIFLTEFHAFIGNRSSFLIPSDIEQRLAKGSLKRYHDQYTKYRNLTTNIAEVQSLIDLINAYHRGYDQEGYIN